ncbi:MAG: ABC transporter substrate-binding protein [Betaproteobacteria bacterium]|nr:ABC transporter substrate-binding protein [Betaproteobacteria bacterium]
MTRCFFMAFITTALIGPVTAADMAPETLVQSVATEVLGIIKNDKDIQSGDAKKVVALVEEKILPHFDFTRMTALAMGLNWRKATAEQKAQLTDQFRTLLVRTYSTALTKYRDQTIEYRPLRAQPGDTDVTVRSLIMQPGAEAITIDYSMEKTSASWKVYDVTVAGISLVTTYRDAFTQEVRKAGVDGLIKRLADKNRQLETKGG